MEFYQVAFNESLKRLPLQQDVISNLTFLDPKIALGVSKIVERSSNTLTSLVDKYKTKVNQESVLNEWSLLPNYFSSEEKTAYLNFPVLEFWKRIEECHNFNSEFLLKNLGKLAKICLSLPHSNSAVERIFSMVSDIKTKKRNKLSAKTVSSLVRVKLDMSNMNKKCYNYPITDEMLKLFNENM